MGLDTIAADHDIEEGYCVGTFRWKRGKEFPLLPPFEKDHQSQGSYLPNLQNWQIFLQQRGGRHLVETATKDLSLIDCLSFPLSAAYSIIELEQLADYNISNVVVVGATYKAEIRILQETSYWDEVCHAVGRQVNLYFVGPEAQKDSAVVEKPKFEVYPGSTTHFLLRRKELLIGNRTMVIGFNPGFGSGSKELLESWCSDLKFLAAAQLPCFFTCANDYSDLRGEILVLQKLVGCQFIMKPKRNPFHMALTTMDHENQALWSCGNSFVYAFKGVKSARPGPARSLPRTKDTVLRLLQAFAKDASWTIAELSGIDISSESRKGPEKSKALKDDSIWLLE